MFQGLRTVTYGTKDIAASKEWYSKVLGFAPYFDEPFYVGFNVGGYELGIDPGTAPGNGASNGTNSFWGVDNAETAFARLIELGATSVGPVEDVGDGVKVGLLADPFGNVIGIIENPHFELPKA